MEGKKLISVKVSTLLLIAIIIILILIGILFFIQYINKGDDTSQSNVNSTIDENTSNTNSTANTVSNSIDNPSVISTQYEEITSNLDGIDVLFVTDALDNGDDTYTLRGVIYTQYTLSEDEFDQIVFDKQLEINNEFLDLQNTNNEYSLVDDSGNVIYNIVKNNDDTYYLESASQSSNVWKLTDDYMEITASSDTPCSIIESGTTTVSDWFGNYSSDLPSNTTNPDSKYCYTFNFENDNCTEVINVNTNNQ